MVYSENILKIKQISGGKHFPSININPFFLLGPKKILFLLSFLKLVKIFFFQIQDNLAKQFFNLKAFDKHTLCTSTYYKHNNEGIHLAVTEFLMEMETEWSKGTPCRVHEMVRIPLILQGVFFSLLLWHLQSWCFFIHPGLERNGNSFVTGHSQHGVKQL